MRLLLHPMRPMLSDMVRSLLGASARLSLAVFYRMRLDGLAQMREACDRDYDVLPVLLTSALTFPFYFRKATRRRICTAFFFWSWSLNPWGKA